jgi:ABC-type glycerol-3-phosphate transport system permease component
MFISSFKAGGDIASTPLKINWSTLSFTNYTTLLEYVPLWRGFMNTGIVLLFQGGFTMLFCPLAGFAFAKLNFKGRKWLFITCLCTIMMPPVILIIPLFMEMGNLEWVDTYQGLILPGAIGAFGIFLTRGQIAEIPDELLDAGRIDGCSNFGLYWRIVVPIIRPVLSALAILTFIGIYNDFVWPTIVTQSESMQTLAVQLSQLYLQINNAQPGLAGHDAWGEVIAAAVLATIPMLALFLGLQKQFVQGILSGSVKG